MILLGDKQPERDPKKGLNRYFRKWGHPYDEMLILQSNSVEEEMVKLFTGKRQFPLEILVFSMDPEEDGIAIKLNPLDNRSHLFCAEKICKMMGLLEPKRYGLYLEVQNAETDSQKFTLQKYDSLSFFIAKASNVNCQKFAETCFCKQKRRSCHMQIFGSNN